MMIHFIRPFWLLALIPIMLYVAWTIYLSRQHNPWRKICDAHLLPALLLPSAKSSRGFYYLTLFSFLILTIFALAGPAWQKTKSPVFRDLNSLMIVLDLSTAMENTDLKPDRLTRAKLKIRDLINASQHTEMGLVAFSGEAFVAAPLSQDANTLHGLLDELYPQMMPISGTEMGQGLTQGLTLLKQAAIQRSILLLITASEPTASSWAAAKAIYDAGNQLYILAMIDPALNPTLVTRLQELAKVGGGSLLLFTPDDKDIKSIVSHYHSAQSIKAEDLENAELWKDAGPWLCLFLIPLAILVLREKLS